MQSHGAGMDYPYNSPHSESGHSSLPSREMEFKNPPPWDDSRTNYKVKLVCSYGGKILLRSHDNKLSYIGGETKILSVDRNIKLNLLLSKLIALCDYVSISFKYQLPGEDLDALISVKNEDDLEHMMVEYDRLYRVSSKPARLRIFIFPSLNPKLSSSDEAKIVKEAFNSARAPQPSVPPATAASNVDYLLGFEKANAHQPAAGRVQQLEDPPILPGPDERFAGSDPTQIQYIQDLQRVKIEEDQGMYRRKCEDYLSGEEYHKLPEKLSQVPVPYWAEKPFPGGLFPVNNEQQIYMIPAPIMRPVNGAPNQGYYTIQRMPAEVYQQQHLYNMIPHGAVPSVVEAAIPSLPPHKVIGYSEDFGMVTQTNRGGGGVTEAGYKPPAPAPLTAYDGSAGRSPGNGAPAATAQYQGLAAGDVRQQ